MLSTKEKIDALPARELHEFRTEAENLPSKNDQLVAAGQFLARHWVMHWNSTDSEYLLQKANVKIKYKTNGKS